MAKNTFRPKPEPRPEPRIRRNKRGLFSFLDRFFNMNKLLGGALPVDYLPHVLWGTVLTLVYIGCSNRADRLVRETEKTQRNIAEKRAEYITLKSSFMKESKQSEIAKRVNSIGLQENKVPPQKIVVKKEEE